MEASRTIGIVGLGLIGGSMAVDLRARGYASRFIGTDKNPLNAEAACRLGLVDRVVPLEKCIEESDIIVVSVPVSAAAGIIHTVLDAFKDKGYTDKIVMDVCSTKSPDEIAWLNAYNERVYRTLSPRLPADIAAWRGCWTTSWPPARS